MRITGATATQLRAITLLRSDLSSAGVKMPTKLFVKVGGEDLEDKDLGGHMPYSDGSHVLSLAADLAPGMVYFTLLHELGHAMGLAHTKRGVMAPKDKNKERKLTLRNRRKWLRDFIQRLAIKRLEALQ